MSERRRPLPPAEIWEREALELAAERAACDDPDERRVIATELWQRGAAIAEWNKRSESRALLPTVWQTIYGEDPGVIGLLSGTRDGKRLTRARSAYYRWPQDVRAAMQWAADEDEAGRECYQCAHLLTRPRRRKEDAAPLRTLYVDLDQGGLSGNVPPATMVVESSPSRLQCYWRLTTPVPPNVGEHLNRRLAVALDADRSGWDLTQLLRVPGTRNHKHSDAPMVRVTSLTTDAYEPEFLSSFLPDVPRLPSAHTSRVQRHRAQEGADASGPPVRLSSAAREVWDGADAKRTSDAKVDRSASLVQIARVLFEAGLTGSQLAAALAERDASLGWKKYTDRRDAEAQYQRVVDLVARGSRTRRRRDWSR